MILELASYTAAEYPLPMEAMLQSRLCHFSVSVETHIPDNSVALSRFQLPSE